MVCKTVLSLYSRALLHLPAQVTYIIFMMPSHSLTQSPCCSDARVLDQLLYKWRHSSRRDVCWQQPWRSITHGWVPLSPLCSLTVVSLPPLPPGLFRSGWPITRRADIVSDVHDVCGGSYEGFMVAHELERILLQRNQQLYIIYIRIYLKEATSREADNHNYMEWRSKSGRK